ncbi:hypothetical protein [Methylovirgula sp. HY1]|uniref:hypothetical protein n=1 Tax=Methylovirgula sp. HY1 TaxID=2822761 RepID=UPI001C5B9A23|nr:hypothetical protein [Methylovirgula sp. HY1]
MQDEDVGVLSYCIGDILCERAGIAPIAFMYGVVLIEPGEPFLVLGGTMIVAVALVSGGFCAKGAVCADFSRELGTCTSASRCTGGTRTALGLENLRRSTLEKSHSSFIAIYSPYVVLAVLPRFITGRSPC